MTLHKYQALGNDYLVMDANQYPEIPDREFIINICDRHYGPGSDGLLYGPLYIEETPSLLIFNPDGSEAEKSGNGIRIFSKYLLDAGYMNKNEFQLITKGGIVSVTYLDSHGENIKVLMGKPTFNPDIYLRNEFIIDRNMQLTSVNIGNPHCVLLEENPSPYIAEKYGSFIEQMNLFPDKTNVQFMKIIDRSTIQIEIWERGAGYTFASGSSSSAAAAAAYKMGLVDADITVTMPGGTIIININQDNSLFMTGPVKKVMDCSI